MSGYRVKWKKFDQGWGGRVEHDGEPTTNWDHISIYPRGGWRRTWRWKLSYGDIKGKSNDLREAKKLAASVAIIVAEMGDERVRRWEARQAG